MVKGRRGVREWRDEAKCWLKKARAFIKGMKRPTEKEREVGKRAVSVDRR